MYNIKKSMANIFVVVGGENSGKDEIIRAVHDLGGLHAQVVPKFTSRERHEDDGKEIRCNYIFEEDTNTGKYRVISQEDDKEFCCDIVYYKNNNYYGIDTHQIWVGLRNKKFQVIVVSEVEAINHIRKKFGRLVVLIYVHSFNEERISEEFKLFLDNFNTFDHVLIAESKKEDLYDQLFRLFRSYE